MEQGIRRATKAQGAVPALATSFIVVQPPDSGTAGRRWKEGQRLEQPIVAGRLARQCPPRSPVSSNQKEDGGGSSLSFSLVDGREGEGAESKSEGRGSGVRE